jgi:choline dehydrogenase-like flavoprotein
MSVNQYDVVIIGSGAGGGTMALALADSGARILIVERGDAVPQEDENWSPEAVWKHLRYRTKEQWFDGAGEPFRPYTHYGVGGNTKFWGSVLYRLRCDDFRAIEHADGVSPAWPIDYDTLAPYYDRAERLYHVHGQDGTDPTEPVRGPFPYEPIPHSRGMQEIVAGLRRLGLHPSPRKSAASRRHWRTGTSNSGPTPSRAGLSPTGQAAGSSRSKSIVAAPSSTCTLIPSLFPAGR